VTEPFSIARGARGWLHGLAAALLQDAQNVFDGATAFLAGKEWEVDETAERLAGEGRIEPLIVVAVDNGGERRIFEYTPTRDRRHEGGGGGDTYGRMLVEELKPWVDRTYRTRPDPEHTGIGGSSMGSLVSLYLGLKRPPHNETAWAKRMPAVLEFLFPPGPADPRPR